MYRFKFMLLVAVFAHSSAFAIDVDEAWMRAMPPGQPTAAAYVTLNNPDAEAVTLIAAESPLAGKVEIHESIQQDGMWRMRRVADVPVAPGQRVKMAPGGVHLMLFDLKHPLKEGETLPLSLELDNGESLQVDVTVRGLDAGAHDHHHH